MAEDAPEPSEAPLSGALRRDGPAVLAMGALFLTSIVLAMIFSFTFSDQHLQAFPDANNLANPLIYLAIVVAFTVALLLVARLWKRVVVKYVILASVFMTAAYVLSPLLGIVLPGGPRTSGVTVANVLGFAIAAGLTILLWFFPEWYVVDLVGLLVAAGAAGIFGISFGLLPSLVLLVAFAVYDAIAVYRTKHMLDLADSVLELRLPIMFVVPKTRGYSFLQETRRIKEPGPEDAPEKREAMFMGLGDAVIPGILVVSAMSFLDSATLVGGLPGGLVVALATLAGSLAGFAVLMYFVMKGNPHAGLPLLNGGAIVGFLLALLPTYGWGPIIHFVL